MPFSATHLSFVVAMSTLLFSSVGEAQAVGVSLYPANRAVGIDPDTHLILTFPNPPTIGKAGQIRIYDAAGHYLVDTLDMSIPAGPDPSRRVTAPAGSGTPLPDSIPTSPTTTTPAIRMTPADLHNYQLVTIGGLENFHFYPVIVNGDVATIYPHNQVLRYGHRYIVQIDAGVLNPAEGRLCRLHNESSVDLHDEEDGAPGGRAPRGRGCRRQRRLQHRPGSR
jgi:hypothetical protein